jgi:hypothetical protein
MLVLHSLMPFFHTMHVLIKFVQMRDVYICDFVIGMKLTQMGLYRLYINPLVKYLDDDFMSFNNVFDETPY